MQKHPQIKKGNQASLCSFTPQIMSGNLPVSRYAFNRYIGKASFSHVQAPGVRVYQLPCGCYVWVYQSGLRELSALPF
jgi:hypothetical protein